MELVSLRGVSQEKLVLEESAVANSVWSKLSFSWAYDVVRKVPRDMNSRIFQLPAQLNVESETLSECLKNHKLFPAIFLTNFKPLSISILLEIACVLIEFTSPIYMELLLDYLDSEASSPLWYSILLPTSFTFITLIYPVIDTHRTFYTECFAIKLRSSLYHCIYEKSLSSSALPEGLGINILQVDADRIYEFFTFLPYAICIPIQIFFSIYLIHQQLGEAVWIAVVALAVAVLGNLALSSTCTNANEHLMAIRDLRISQSSAFLSDIKTIKSNSWEDNFTKKIDRTRKSELKHLRLINLLNSFNNFYFWTLPSVVAVVVILYYTVIMDKSFDSTQVFVTLTTLFLLQIPMIAVPEAILSVLRVVVSRKRLQGVLDAKSWQPLQSFGEILLDDCTFIYGSTPVLTQISLKISKSEFVAITGPVGSGKSSLLKCLLGEVELKTGILQSNSNVAYTSTFDSFLFSASLRDNIVMGNDFNEERYQLVVEACELLDDIMLLPAGDRTEIGERGINLSLGQKARVALARAVYADKELFLLDDPLSSVDNHVALKIYRKCFLGLLRSKTRVLATHRAVLLDGVDKLVMLKSGRIFKVIEKNERSNLVVQKINEEVEAEENDERVRDKPSRRDSCESDSTEDQLVEDEERESGEVTRAVYYHYFNYSGGQLWIKLAVLCLIIWSACEMLGDIYLKGWSDENDRQSFYFPRYLMFKLGGSVFMLISSLIIDISISLKVSRNCHRSLLSSLSNAPVNLFYDITPTGRILNRLSKDLETIDEEIPFDVSQVLANILQTLACILMGLIYFPYLILFLPIIIYPAKIVTSYYVKASRELTRLETVSKSPIISCFKESLAGNKYIRMYARTGEYIQKNRQMINTNTAMNYYLSGCEQWARILLGLSSAILISALFSGAVLMKGQISASAVGLCMTYIFGLPEDVRELLMSATELENSMISVERIKTYTEIPQEQPKIGSKDKLIPEIFTKAHLQVSKLRVRYRPGCDLVLTGLNFEAKDGQRIGITGRTGSGKSTLFMALLRIIEAESGVISINGINIALIGLERLRKNITLVSQDPLIFNGTLKENLDPFNINSENIEAVLNYLDLPFALDYEIKDTGQNISVGQRQLLSLGRALIGHTKLLLFDEATAGIDKLQDETIRRIIKEKFTGCTVLTIAHRIETIIDCDLVLVIDKGKSLEFESPQVLMQRPSEFKNLVESGKII